MGAGMGNVMGGAMGQYQSQVTPNQSPLQQAIGIASLGLWSLQRYAWKQLIMFNRTLRRPMFRRGGKAEGGITSGLRRQGYDGEGDISTGSKNGKNSTRN